MELKNKYIRRIVMATETEIDNIFSFDETDCDFDLEKESIIDRNIVNALNEIKELDSNRNKTKR